MSQAYHLEMMIVVYNRIVLANSEIVKFLLIDMRGVMDYRHIDHVAFMEISAFFVDAMECAPFRILIHGGSSFTGFGKALRSVFSLEKLKFPGKPLQFNLSKRQQIAFAFNIFPCPQCSRADAIGISNTGFDPRRTPPARAMC